MQTLLAALILCLCLRAAAPAAELSLSGSTDSAFKTPPPLDASAATVALPAARDLSVPGTGRMAASLTLDSPKSAPTVATMNLNLPPVPAGNGLPDPWVYAGLGTMLLALAWACSGSLSRLQTAPPPVSEERRSVRTRRVHMLPLDVSR